MMTRYCYWHPDFLPASPLGASKYFEPDTIVLVDGFSYQILDKSTYFLMIERNLTNGDTMMQSFKSRFFAEKFIAEKIKDQKRPL